MKPSQEILDRMPEFPRMRHLPWKANAKRDDLVASPEECEAIFRSPVMVQEKVDGAQCRMGILDGHPLIGNRNHILTKNYSRQRTAATMQFSPIWGWWYEHRKSFEALRSLGPYTLYGDWMYMAHGMVYDRLPSLFIVYDVYNYEDRRFLDEFEFRCLIERNLDDLDGFVTVGWCWAGNVSSYEFLENMANAKSSFSSDQPREGVVVKCGDQRWKMVRQGFDQGCLLSKTNIIRNHLA